jgi:hypothetical protein
LAGVNEETGSKLRETAAGRFFDGIPVAIAGVSTRPAAVIAATSLELERCATLSTINSLSNVDIATVT